MFLSATASAPGKAILFGEHAVVHGVTAIAAALSDLRIFADITLKPGRSELVATFSDVTPIGDDGEAKPIVVSFEKLQQAMPYNADPNTAIHPDKDQQQTLSVKFAEADPISTQGIVTVAYLVANILSDVVWNKLYGTYDIEITIKSHGLPIGAGLGSSAAFSVAVAGACIKLLKSMDIRDIRLPPVDSGVASMLGTGTANNIDTDDGWILPDSDVLPIINDWSYAAEILNHGNPSGLDNATSCYGGLVKFNKTTNGQSTFEKITQVPSLYILLTNTKVRV